jgi:hypothetical protein
VNNQENELSKLAVVAAITIVLAYHCQRRLIDIMLILSKRKDNSYETDCRSNKVTMTKQ